MSKLDQYNIQFPGLKEGKHLFEFKIGKDFFSEFGDTEISNAEIKVKAIFEKNSRYLSFDFELTGNVVSVCDRCLDPIKIEIDYSPKLYINFGDETSDITDIDDTMILARSEDTIKLAKHFYDYIYINMPIQKLHEDDEDGDSTCNPEMLDNIEKVMFAEKENSDIDPRWEKLKNLNN